MGLDMYLTRKVYLEEKDMQTDIVVKDRKFSFSKIELIVEEVAYWRKANQIHNWFLQNTELIQKDGYLFSVYPNDLIALYEKCVTAHFSKDPKILPPVDGFYFGGIDTDKYYWREIIETIRILKPIVDIMKSAGKKMEQDHNVSNLTDEEYKLYVLSTYEYYASW